MSNCLRMLKEQEHASFFLTIFVFWFSRLLCFCLFLSDTLLVRKNMKKSMVRKINISMKHWSLTHHASGACVHAMGHQPRREQLGPNAHKFEYRIAQRAQGVADSGAVTYMMRSGPSECIPRRRNCQLKKELSYRENCAGCQPTSLRVRTPQVRLRCYDLRNASGEHRGLPNPTGRGPPDD